MWYLHSSTNIVRCKDTTSDFTDQITFAVNVCYESLSRLNNSRVGICPNIHMRKGLELLRRKSLCKNIVHHRY